MKKLLTETLKYWVGVQQGQFYLKERMCLFSLGWHPSSDGVTMKIPYEVDVLLHWLDSHLVFSYWIGQN